MSELTPENKQRLIEDALKKSRFNPKVLEDGEKLQQHMEHIINTTVTTEMERFSKVRFNPLHNNKLALIVSVQKNMLDGFCQFDRDELLYLITMLVSKEAAEHVYNNA